MHGTHSFKICKVYLKEHVLYVHFEVKIKVKQCIYWPGQRVPGDGGSQMSRQTAHEGGKVSRTHRPPLPTSPQKYS